MVKRNMWLDVTPQGSKATANRGIQVDQWLTGTVTEQVDSSNVAVELDGSDSTPVVAPVTAGITYIGARVRVLRDSTGRIIQVEAPLDLPDGVDTIAVGSTGWAIMDAQSGVNETQEALDQAKTELESSQAQLASNLSVTDAKLDAAQDYITNTVTPGLQAAQSAADAAADAAAQAVADGVVSVVTEWAVGSSETTAPTSGWSTSTPARTAGTFIWSRATTTKGDGSSSTSSPVLVTGNTGATGATGSDGAPGKDGVGLSGTAVTYAKSTSGTTAPSSGWQTTVPSSTPGQYLWTRTVWSYSDGTSETGYSVAMWGATGAKGDTGSDGVAGKDGVGISSTSIMYAASSSGTTAPTSGWVSTPPSASAGQYVWTRTVWTYTDGTTETGYSVGKIGNTGAKGDTGSTGAQGVSVSSVTPYYCLVGTGASAPAKPTTNPPSSSWTLTEPSYQSSTELYRCDLTVMSDGSWSWGAVSKVSAYTAANAAMDQAVSGSVEACRNLCVYPGGTNSAVFGGWAGVGGKWTMSIVDVAWTHSGKAGQAKWTVAGSGDYGVCISGPSHDGLVVGTTYTVEFDVVMNIDTTLVAPYFGGANLTGYSIVNGSPATQVNAGEVTHLWATFIAGTGTDARVGLSWGSTRNAGDTIQIGNILTYAGTYRSLGYFDGSYSPDPDLTPSWTGTANASASVLTRWSQALTVANLATAMAQGLVTASTTAPDVTQVGRVWLVLNAAGNVVGMKISNGSAWTSYTLMADQVLVPSSVGTVSLANGAVTAPKITATSDLWAKVLAVAGDATIGGNLLANGAVTASKITASSELWAKIATFAKVTTDMLTAGGAKITGSLLADVISLATRLVAGDPDGARVELNETGLSVWRMLADGTAAQAINLGITEGGDYLTLLSSGGDTVASIDEDGNVSGQVVSASDSILLAGADLGDTINALPQGVIAKTYLNTSAFQLTGTAQTVLSTDFTLSGSGDRQIRATISVAHRSNGEPVLIQLHGNTSGTATSGNSPIKAWQDVGTDEIQSATYTYEFNSNELGVDADGDRFLSLAISGKTSTAGSTAGNVSIRGGIYETSITVEDIGSAVPSGRQANTSSGTSKGSLTKTKTYTATASKSYQSSGAAYGYGGSRVFQGSYGSNSNLRGMWIFPTSILSDLSGATVNKVVLRLTNQHSYYNSGATARIVAHSSTSLPGTWSSPGSVIASVAFAKGQTRNIDLTSALKAGLKSGSIRGVGLYSTASGDYGYWSPTAELIITYTK